MRFPHLLLVSLGLLVLQSCSKGGSGDEPAPVLNPPSTVQQAKATSGDTLRIMTYNIHHCNPPSKEAAGTIELNTTASVISKENPDIIALQEVDVNTKRSGFTDQAQLLAQKLGMTAYFGKAINYDGGGYGVAILSKFALSNSVTYPLPETANPSSEDRVLAVSSINFRNGRSIYFGSTHLDVTNAGNRDLQAAEINRIAGLQSAPFIVAGDMNADPQSNAIQILEQKFIRTCSSCDFTIPVNNPTKTIDHIAFTKGAAISVRFTKAIQEKYASDHLPVITELIIK